ncbi:MAG: hypothetical protein AVDCRST_MAG72-483, partial [uncultured Nocardioidaceae bacterium]
AARLPLPPEMGRHGLVRARQQRGLRRLPARGAGGHARRPRAGNRGRGAGRGRRGGPPRGGLRRSARLPARAGPDRVVGQPDPVRLVHHEVRDPRPARRRTQDGVRPRSDGADAVRFRRGATATYPPARDRHPAPLPRAGRGGDLV